MRTNAKPAASAVEPTNDRRSVGWTPSVLIVVACFLSGEAVSAVVAADDTESADVAGVWHGRIEVPGMPLEVRVELERHPDGWRGTVDIPAQNARGLPLVGVEVSASRVRFEISGVPGAPTFDGGLDGRGRASEIRGELMQAGQIYPLTLGRDRLEKARRPQEPVAPFPYVSEEIHYRSGELELAGTLTLPREIDRKDGDGVPAVILVTGSGAQDRDQSLLGHRPFLVLADRLTRAGFAVLRTDDRGVGGSGGELATSTTVELADDVLGAVDWLRDDRRIADEAIGVAGHSEGALVAAAAAARSDDLAFLVMLSGPGVPGADILVEQLERIARANGVPEASIARQLELQQRVLEVVRSEAPGAARRQALAEIVRLQIGVERLAEGEALDAAIEQSIGAVLTRWFEFFVDYDPRPTLQQVDVPVLVLSGGLDLQVPAEQNVPEIVAALLAGGNHDVTARVLPKLNHLFQTAVTGSPQEYAMIEETFSDRASGVIVDWLQTRFARQSADASDAGRTAGEADERREPDQR